MANKLDNYISTVTHEQNQLTTRSRLLFLYANKNRQEAAGEDASVREFFTHSRSTAASDKTQTCHSQPK